MSIHLATEMKSCFIAKHKTTKRPPSHTHTHTHTHTTHTQLTHTHAHTHTQLTLTHTVGKGNYAVRGPGFLCWEFFSRAGGVFAFSLCCVSPADP